MVWQIAERIYCALFLSATVLWSLHGSTVGGNGVRGKPPMLGMAGDGLCNDRVVVRFQNGAWRSHRTSRPRLDVDLSFSSSSSSRLLNDPLSVLTTQAATGS